MAGNFLPSLSWHIGSDLASKAAELPAFGSELNILLHEYIDLHFQFVDLFHVYPTLVSTLLVFQHPLQSLDVRLLLCDDPTVSESLVLSVCSLAEGVEIL
jgi:hypothetical protein